MWIHFLVARELELKARNWLWIECTYRKNDFAKGALEPKRVYSKRHKPPRFVWLNSKYAVTVTRHMARTTFARLKRFAVVEVDVSKREET